MHSHILQQKRTMGNLEGQRFLSHVWMVRCAFPLPDGQGWERFCVSKMFKLLRQEMFWGLNPSPP